MVIEDEPIFGSDEIIAWLEDRLAPHNPFHGISQEF
jgi:hypothetical protein